MNIKEDPTSLPPDQLKLGRSIQEPHSRKHYNVLFLCADNSICSIMAEALLRRWGAEDFAAYSAGTTPNGAIHPLAVDLLKDRRVWCDDLRSKSCGEFLKANSPNMDFVISLGAQPPSGLPSAWPGDPQVIHWHITVPLINGELSKVVRSFGRAFMELENRIRLFVLVYHKEALERAAAA